YVWINSTRYGPFPFWNAVTDVDRIRSYLATAATYTASFDAFGFSWDPNYNIGDNEFLVGNEYSDNQLSFTEVNEFYFGDSLDVYFELDERTGIYPATYGFESEADGTTGLDIDFVDTYHNHPPSTYAMIVSDFQGHSKVLQMYDHSSSDVALTNTLLDEAQTYGTIEYWMATSDPTRANVIYLKNGSTILIGFRIDEDNFKVQLSGWTIIGGTPAANTWYHIRVDFELTTGGYQGLSQYTFYIYIDGVRYGPYSTVLNQGQITDIAMVTSNSDNPYELYFDAFGYSWDSNYNIGDNMEPLRPEPFPLYDMATPLMGLIDNSTNTLLGLSTINWDASVNKYHSKFTLMEEIGEYSLKFMLISTDVETQVNSSNLL
ncbi:hypothetical protein LCGC14_2954080, partial [marine sediment metagenome]